MLQIYANIFITHFVSPQIPDDRSQQIFFAQMTSCAAHYDIIYHPFPINSQSLKTRGVDSPVNVFSYNQGLHSCYFFPNNPASSTKILADPTSWVAIKSCIPSRNDAYSQIPYCIFWLNPGC